MTNAAPAAIPGSQTLTMRVAAELRAELARHRVSGRHLARELGVAHTWAAQRTNGTIALSSEDIDRIAHVLRMDPAALWGRLQPPPVESLKNAFTPDFDWSQGRSHFESAQVTAISGDFSASSRWPENLPASPVVTSLRPRHTELGVAHTVGTRMVQRADAG